MHGFFVDIRLYNKAMSVVEPFAFDKFRKDKIRQKIEEARPNRLQIKSNLPKVNQEMALKVMDQKDSKKKKGSNLLEDNRFAAMFENPEFEIDKNADEYKMLTPVLSRLDKTKVKELKRQAMKAQLDDITNEDGAKSSDDDLFSEREDSSDDDDDREWAKDVKKQYKQIRKDKVRSERAEAMEDGEDDGAVDPDPKMIEVATNEFRVKSVRNRVDK